MTPNPGGGGRRPTVLNHRPASATAKKTPGAARVDPNTGLKVASITTPATSPTPTWPMFRCAASAATSGERAISAMGMR